VKREIINEENKKNNNVSGRIGFVEGVVKREKVKGFERMMWRI
jgi:hypothetical protein